MTSAYDYVISEALGFHVDFNKTLGQQYEEVHKIRLRIEKQGQPKFDAVIEKCETSIKELHRPIVWSETAGSANINSTVGGRDIPITAILTHETFDYINYTREDDYHVTIIGRVSSYNMNTYKGRIFVPDEGRPIPFELSVNARNRRVVSLITRSLAVNAASPSDVAGNITCSGFRNTSRSGHLKSYRVVDVQPSD